MAFVKIILLPLSVIYGVVTQINQEFYSEYLYLAFANYF